MTFHHLLSPVAGHGSPPIPFLLELVAFGRTAPDALFAANDEPGDVMGKLRSILGPWQGEAGSAEWLMHRRCSMLELLRCLAGFESSWHWTEGTDMTNARSMAHAESAEAGPFQESFDSLGQEHKHHTLKSLLDRYGVTGPNSFIQRSKTDHVFAMTYAVALLRITKRCNGPLERGEIDSSLSREAVAEIRQILEAGQDAAPSV